MVQVLIDGAEIKDKGMLHAFLKKELELPEWYGNNLDALADCMTEPDFEAEISLIHMEEMTENLGKYADRFVRVLGYVTEENERVTVQVEGDEALE